MSTGRMTANLLARLVGDPSTAGNTQQLAAIPMWFGVFSDDALASSDPLSIEIIGGSSYVRPRASWATYGTTGLVTAAEMPFDAIPPGAHLVSVGLFDAPVNGNLLAADFIRDLTTGLPAPIDFPAGGNWALPSGEFFLGFDLTGL